MPRWRLGRVRGKGSAKVAQLQAAMELARRAALPSVGEKILIKSTKAAAYFAARLRGLAQEHFRVAYLNRQGRLWEDALLAEGAVDSVNPPLRSLIGRALQANASALIAAHNHPSGAPEPSESDRLLTKDILIATRPLGLRVLDHIIIADGASYSFADSGLLDELALEVGAL